MLKRNNRKGFTLAELLIVVAIIAVLVAIAVPLFVGALNNAEQRVGDANVRAVRGLAVEELLLNHGGDEHTYETAKSSGSTTTYVFEGPWLATAKVNMNGQVTELHVKVGSAFDGTGIEANSGTDGYYNKTADGYDVQVIIRELKVT